MEEQGKETEESRPMKLEKEIKRVSVVEHNLRKYFKKRKHSYVSKATDSSCKVRDRIDPWDFIFFKHRGHDNLDKTVLGESCV